MNGIHAGSARMPLSDSSQSIGGNVIILQSKNGGNFSLDAATKVTFNSIFFFFFFFF